MHDGNGIRITYTLSTIVPLPLGTSCMPACRSFRTTTPYRILKLMLSCTIGTCVYVQGTMAPLPNLSTHQAILKYTKCYIAHGGVVGTFLLISRQKLGA